MRIEKLADLCDIVVGRTPSRSNSAFWGSGYPWLSIADMNQGSVITTTTEEITPVAAEKGKLIAPGTVLLSFKLSLGKVARNAIPLYTNEAIAALPIRDTSILDPDYLLRTLENMDFSSGANRAAMGATLNKERLSGIQIPLPPIESQRRIASTLNLADRVVDKRYLLHRQLDELKRAIFVEWFGDPLEPKGLYETEKLGDVADVVTGNTPPRKVPENYGNYIEWLKTDNLGGTFATQAVEYLSEQGLSKGKKAPRGSVLVTCIAGSPTSIGKSSIVDRDVAFNQQINAVLPSSGLEPKFLLSQLKVRPEIVRKKSTGGMKGLVNKSAFQQIEIITPPVDVQQRFVSILDAIDNYLDLHCQASRFDAELFASIQSRAFRDEMP